MGKNRVSCLLDSSQLLRLSADKALVECLWECILIREGWFTLSGDFSNLLCDGGGCNRGFFCQVEAVWERDVHWPIFCWIEYHLHLQLIAKALDHRRYIVQIECHCQYTIHYAACQNVKVNVIRSCWSNLDDYSISTTRKLRLVIIKNFRHYAKCFNSTDILLIDKVTKNWWFTVKLF